MKENEALKYLKDANRKNDMLSVLPNSDIGKCLIKALEKQIPKKPFMHGIEEYRATCPNCNKWLEAHSSKIFCPYCGQRIDWSD
ncbi:MAG: hypothetical protein J6K26_09520 [Lachnospiraceae bacterium]|nr:hypothetical protein [Lachnospiraceae bacterium]